MDRRRGWFCGLLAPAQVSAVAALALLTRGRGRSMARLRA